MSVYDQLMNKIQNAWQVKRKFRVTDAPVQIRVLAGVDDVSWNRKGNRVIVIYDIRTTDYETVLQQLFDAGVIVKQGLWFRWLGKMHQSTDLIGRENASARSAPCCNKPPK